MRWKSAESKGKDGKRKQIMVVPSAPLNDHRNSIRITVVFFYVKCVIYSIDKGENV